MTSDKTTLTQMLMVSIFGEFQMFDDSKNVFSVAFSLFQKDVDAKASFSTGVEPNGPQLLTRNCISSPNIKIVFRTNRIDAILEDTDSNDNLEQINSFYSDLIKQTSINVSRIAVASQLVVYEVNDNYLSTYLNLNDLFGDGICEALIRFNRRITIRNKLINSIVTAQPGQTFIQESKDNPSNLVSKESLIFDLDTNTFVYPEPIRNSFSSEDIKPFVLELIKAGIETMELFFKEKSR
ncbi:MAG: hypothetical protein LKJ88_03270 [Bacilli bacterium]|jgi:hypothetical protein|nr:hypothetical protein [Bacilli bacterium]